MIKYSLILVSFNQGKLLNQCLKSISNDFDKTIEVIVVDNNSTDKKVFEVLDKYQDKLSLKIIKNSQNTGFAKANNQGVQVAKGKWLIFINTDTYWQKGELKKFLQVLDEADEKVVAVGPKLVYPDGKLQYSMGSVPNWINIGFWMLGIDDLPGVKKLIAAYHINDKGAYQKRFYPGWLGGAFLAVKRQAFKKVGGFDAKIFMYGEDVVLGEKLGRLGKLMYEPGIKIVHVGSGSSHKFYSFKKEIEFLKGYMKEKYGVAGEIIFNGLVKIGFFLRSLAFWVLGNRQKAKFYWSNLNV